MSILASAISRRIENTRIYQLVIVAFITIFGTALRFYKLGEWSFWGDEMITVNRASGIMDSSIVLSSVSLVVTNLSFHVFGTSEWSARLIPALIGILTIPVLYYFVKIILDSTTAIFSALLLSVSTWHLYWSQNARFYTALVLFYTIALFAFYIGMEKDRPVLLIISMISFGFALQERMVAVVLVFVLAGYILLIKIFRFETPPGFRMRNFAIFLVPGFLAGTYIVFTFIQQPSSFLQLFGWIYDRVNNNPLWILSGSAYYIGIPTIIMGTLGGSYLLLNKSRSSLLLLLGAVLPVVMITGISSFVYTANRYLFISLICWIILAAVSVRELLLQVPGKVRILVIGMLLVLLLHPLSENVLYYQYQNGNRDNWKAAFEVIKQQKQPGDIVISADRMLANYYLQENAIGMVNLSKQDLESMEGRIWFVEDMNVQQKWPWISMWMSENAKMVANFDVNVRARNYLIRVYRTE